MSMPANFAAAMAIAAASRTTWDVTWAGKYMGLMDKVTPDVKLEFSMITTGTTGPKIPLGWRFEGVAGTIKCEARQITPDLQNFTLPWNTSNPANSSQASLTPLINADLYSFAQPLILHPHELTVTTQDLVLVKACPMSFPDIKKDGKNDDVWEIEFALMIDKSLLASNPTQPIIGYWGQ